MEREREGGSAHSGTREREKRIEKTQFVDEKHARHRQSVQMVRRAPNRRAPSPSQSVVVVVVV